MRIMAIVMSALVLGSVAGVAAAQEDMPVGIEVGFSTLGRYVAPTYKINDRLTVRFPVYFGSMSGELDVEGNTVDAKFGLENGTLTADFAPWGNAVRLSGGIGVGGYDLTGTATDLTLDGTTFVGVSTVNIVQKAEVAPVLSIGFHRAFENGLTLSGDIGGRFATYEVSVQTEGVLAPADQADLDASVADFNSDLAKFGVTPFLSIGIGFQF